MRQDQGWDGIQQTMVEWVVLHRFSACRHVCWRRRMQCAATDFAHRISNGGNGFRRLRAA